MPKSAKSPAPSPTTVPATTTAAAPGTKPAAKKAAVPKPAPAVSKPAGAPAGKAAEGNAKTTPKAAVKTPPKTAKADAKATVKATVKASAKKALPKRAAKRVTKKAKVISTSTPPSASTAKPAPVKVALPKVKKHKTVRDSFNMPMDDYVLIAVLKKRALAAAREVKKSELLRAGLKALAAMTDATFATALKSVTPVKTGRPGKSK